MRGTAITSGGAVKFLNERGDLTVNAKAGTTLGATHILTVEAGATGFVSDIDIILDASQVTGNVGATGAALVVDNKGTDSALRHR